MQIMLVLEYNYTNFISAYFHLIKLSSLLTWLWCLIVLLIRLKRFYEILFLSYFLNRFISVWYQFNICFTSARVVCIYLFTCNVILVTIYLLFSLELHCIFPAEVSIFHTSSPSTLAFVTSVFYWHSIHVHRHHLI